MVEQLTAIESGTKEAREQLGTTIPYPTADEDRVSCGKYRRRGYRVGGGFERAGMGWGEQVAEALLDLVIRMEYSKWDASWRSHDATQAIGRSNMNPSGIPA